jgi:hypothetical protein
MRSPDIKAPQSRPYRLRLAMLGSIVVFLGLAMYLSAIVLSLVRLAFFRTSEAAELIADLLWYSGVPTSLGIVLVVLDFFFCCRESGCMNGALRIVRQVPKGLRLH